MPTTSTNIPTYALHSDCSLYKSNRSFHTTVIDVYRTTMAESSNDQPSLKRKRFDWTTKTDPHTGAVTRFCSRCQEFLPLDRFYPSSIKDGSLSCKTHCNERLRATKNEWQRRKRGKPRSYARILTNLNVWIRKQPHEMNIWTESAVKRVLDDHGINLDSESRIPRLRPRDPDQPFDTNNVVVKFQKSSKLFQVPPPK